MTAWARRLALVALLALAPRVAAAQSPEPSGNAPVVGTSPALAHHDPTPTPTEPAPTATHTVTPTASHTATATPTLEPPSDPIALVIYGVVVGGSHPWLRARVFPGFEPPLRRLYEPGELAPIWVRDGKPTAQALAMIAAFDTADERGLSRQDYDVQTLRDAAQRLADSSTPSDEEVGLFDSALSISTLRYVSDAYVGRIDPRRVDFPYDAPRRSFDPATVAREIADGAEPVARLAQLDPPFPQFAALRDALGRYRALAARKDLAAIPRLPKLRPGESDPGVPVLRAHLAALGDLPADAPTPSGEHARVYDAALAQAVKHYQARNGLAADGVIGAGTLQALQVPIADRVEQIELAMERMRWLPYAWPHRFIVVNIPEFRLRAYNAGSGMPPLEMNVVVGEAELAPNHETPVLMADMQYVVFRPYWMVPTSIFKKELAPKIASDPSYLERNQMEVHKGRIRQKPGPKNSLGLVKFIFPNPHHVYLHDTPSKGLFARTRRDFSHGCIRVANPPALAAYVLAETPGWDPERIARAMSSGPDDRHVPLATPIPVYLLYNTAVADDAGQVHFFDDIYGHDASLQRQLAKGYPY
ncbi:MAG TPA: L,D-transpeptidase family protein [Candidatus Dormibacteraeota bacterium]|nr:L,D-transpeptidase family protein [Candidatus Dormibacteraeota bacterium]